MQEKINNVNHGDICFVVYNHHHNVYIKSGYIHKVYNIFVIDADEKHSLVATDFYDGKYKLIKSYLKFISNKVLFKDIEDISQALKIIYDHYKYDYDEIIINSICDQIIKMYNNNKFIDYKIHINEVNNL